MRRSEARGAHGAPGAGGHDARKEASDTVSAPEPCPLGPAPWAAGASVPGFSSEQRSGQPRDSAEDAAP